MQPINIAVAIPTYRRPELLSQLTRSIPEQVSISVSDNASSMLPMTASFGDNVRIHHAEGLLPIFTNWNRAVSFVDESATHVLIPSDDDLYLPTAFETIRKTLAAHPDADTYVFGCDLVDAHGQSRPGYRPEREEALPVGEGFLKFQNGVAARMPGVLFRRDFLARIGGFDESFELTASDSELIQRALLLGSSVFTPEVIGLYRVWPGSLTHARQATDLWMTEVTQWTDKIAGLLAAGHQPQTRTVNIEAYRDEIIAQNLLAGLHNLIAKGERAEARAFLGRQRMPARATWRTRLRLLRCQWKLRSAAR